MFGGAIRWKGAKGRPTPTPLSAQMAVTTVVSPGRRNLQVDRMDLLEIIALYE